MACGVKATYLYHRIIKWFLLTYQFQCLKCSAEFSRPANSDDLLCPDCGSSMTVLVSSPEHEKPVLPLRSIEDYVREHAEASRLNTSSIKTLNGEMSVTALINISPSSSSSSYVDAIDQLTTQEPVQTENAEYSKSKVLSSEENQYVFCFCLYNFS